MNSIIRKVKIEMIILVNTLTSDLSEAALLKGIADNFNPENIEMQLTSGHDYSVLEYKSEEIKD